ncbi:MAG: NUDIX hydrolase [Clostridiales bacterium]|nr:NUDIX hydrolase [Clostridiales bacterium]
MGKTDCRDDELFEKTLNTQTVFEGKVFDCILKDVELVDGSVAKREVVLHTGGACILPVDRDLNCYMVKQYRSGADEVLIEVPAGKIEKGEDPLECALREIEEETGFESGNVISLGSMCATPAYCSERIHMYLATDLKYKGVKPDKGEFLGVVRYPLNTLVEMCDNGLIKDSKTIICIYKAARRLLK